MGEVEVDEVFLGGKEKNKHRGHHRPRSQGGAGKTEVIGAIARKGNVECQIINRGETNAHQNFVPKVISPKMSLVSTDEAHHYWALNDMGYSRDIVHHRGMTMCAVGRTRNRLNRSKKPETDELRERLEKPE